MEFHDTINSDSDVLELLSEMMSDAERAFIRIVITVVVNKFGEVEEDSDQYHKLSKAVIVALTKQDVSAFEAIEKLESEIVEIFS